MACIPVQYLNLINLSFIGLCYTSVSSQKLLINFVSEKSAISYVGCLMHTGSLSLFSVIFECYTLSLVAYDCM